MKINRKSDFDFILAIPGENGAAVFPAVDFSGRLTTDKSSSVSYVFARKGEDYLNCVLDGEQIHVICNNHDLPPGKLTLELTLFHPSTLYPDGYKREVLTQTLDIELTAGMTDMAEIGVVFANPYIFVTSDDRVVAMEYDGTYDELKRAISEIRNSSEMAQQAVQTANQVVNEARAATTEAVESANVATQSAIDATNLALQASESASRSASDADLAASNANSAASSADDAAEMAKSAAVSAQSSADSAENAANNAISVMQSANSATEAANIAATEAKSAASNASSAANAAAQATTEVLCYDEEIKQLQNAVFPLFVSLSVSKSLLEYTGEAQEVDVTALIKRNGEIIDGSAIDNLSVTVNGEEISVTNSGEFTFKASCGRLGFNPIVVTATAYGVTNTATINVRLERAMYFGFSPAADAGETLIGSLEKQEIRTSPNGTYSLVNRASGSYLWLCVPANMSVSLVTHNGYRVGLVATTFRDYTCFRSESTYTAGNITINVESNLIPTRNG